MNTESLKEKQKLAVRAQNLGKIFRNPKTIGDFCKGVAGPPPFRALDSVSFQIHPGEIFVLLGPNGAGKTTLVKTLSTLLLPDSGSAEIFGHTLGRENSSITPLLSLVIGEERSFYWRLTGRQNLEFFAALHNLRAGETRSKIAELSKTFELNDLDKRFDLYSTGAKQRLALARSCLKKNSRLLFMDEPTRGLDPGAKAHLYSLILKMARGQGMTFLITTHDTREASILADRIGILDQGRLKFCGQPDELPRSGNSPAESLDSFFIKVTSES